MSSFFEYFPLAEKKKKKKIKKKENSIFLLQDDAYLLNILFRKKFLFSNKKIPFVATLSWLLCL